MRCSSAPAASYTISGAVDQHGHVLDILVQSRRNARAAKRFFRKLLRGLRYVPRVIVTDKLRSYGAAKREILPGVEHRQSRYLNHRAEVSTSPRGDENGRCSGSSHRAMRNVSSPPIAGSTTTSSFAVSPPHRRPTSGCSRPRLSHLAQSRRSCCHGANSGPAPGSYYPLPQPDNALSAVHGVCVQHHHQHAVLDRVRA